MIRLIFVVIACLFVSCEKSKYKIDGQLTSVKYWDWDFFENKTFCENGLFPCCGEAYFPDYTLHYYSYVIVCEDTFRFFWKKQHQWKPISDDRIVILNSFDTVVYSQYSKDTLQKRYIYKDGTDPSVNFISHSKYPQTKGIELTEY